MKQKAIDNLKLFFKLSSADLLKLRAKTQKQKNTGISLVEISVSKARSNLKARMMNKEEKNYLSKVAALGCIICQNPYVEIHHITTKRGFGTRASHFDTLPLCFLHHRGGEKGVAIHQGVKTWESIYGTQIDLVEKVKSML